MVRSTPNKIGNTLLFYFLFKKSIGSRIHQVCMSPDRMNSQNGSHLAGIPLFIVEQVDDAAWGADRNRNA